MVCFLYIFIREFIFIFGRLPPEMTTESIHIDLSFEREKLKPEKDKRPDHAKLIKYSVFLINKYFT